MNKKCEEIIVERLLKIYNCLAMAYNLISDYCSNDCNPSEKCNECLLQKAQKLIEKAIEKLDPNICKCKEDD